MVSYNFPQSLNEYCYFSNSLNETFFSNLNNIIQPLEYQTAGVKNDFNQSTRNSQIKWILPNDNSKFLYDTLTYYTKYANDSNYSLDIVGSKDAIQYTEYDSKTNDNYDWHLDIGKESTRKLSIIVQLSSPDEYEGGELQLKMGPEPTNIPKQKGFITVFPSFLLHRVTPVTKGLRKSLVWWVGGSQFK